MPKKFSKTPPMADERWLGACVDFPGYVMDGGPIRPQMLIWLDVTNDLIVGHHILEPGQSRSLLGDLLMQTVRQPLAGPSRLPAHIRVATTPDAHSVRAHTGDAVHLSIGPMPEIDIFLSTMQKALAEEDAQKPQKIEDPPVDQAILAGFYGAAADLWRSAPWRMINSDSPLQLNCPKLGVKNWTVCIIGALGEAFAVLLFPTLRTWQTFHEQAKRVEPGKDRIRLPASLFVINFDRGADLPKHLRARIARHNFPIADVGAYPSIARPDPDLLLRPIVEADYYLGAVCAELIAKFFTTHRDAIEGGDLQPTTMTLKVRRDKARASMTLTAPHPKYPW